MANKQKILIVDDDENIANLISLYLTKECYETRIEHNGQSALDAFKEYAPNLILLDIMLPGLDGYEVCREIRRESKVPIIMLSAKTEVFDKVLGLELGADDYITKPYSMRELTARVKANLRRSTAQPVVEEEPENQNTINSGELSINVERYEVAKNGEIIDITLREFELLKFLAMQPDKIFSREKLLENVWGYEYYGDVRTVDVTVRRLREKIEDDPSMPKYIITKRGVGYYFNK